MIGVADPARQRAAANAAPPAALNLFAVFHCNLAYSSIATGQRAEVIRRCYRPLIELIRDGVPLALEASGFTLEILERQAPDLLAELRGLLEDGRCEFVGSGYAQIIGPLVPAAVNRANQRLGLDVYQRLLGRRPRLALVNEQAFSAGMIEHYLDAGYAALFTEWDNPARHHPQWDRTRRFRPQLAAGTDGSRMPVLWNPAIAFQKFQRYAHGELELWRYVDYLTAQIGDDPRLWCLYGNDAEVFDFRPGRYAHEPGLDDGEWRRIRKLIDTLAGRAEFALMLPGQALACDWGPQALQPLELTCAAAPIPVKKQHKYNATRWALTGRGDLPLNSACFRILDYLRSGHGSEADWKLLCTVWSSDLRTHITPERWHKAWLQVSALERRIGFERSGGAERSALAAAAGVALTLPQPGDGPDGGAALTPDPGVEIRRAGASIDVRVPHGRLVFNSRRGLALTGAGDADGAWFGTLEHGYFDDIAWGADFYSGHLVFESPGRPKVTDLTAVTPRLSRHDDGTLELAAAIDTEPGRVDKRWRIHTDRPRLELDCNVDWPGQGQGRLRLGHVTLRPEAFRRDRLFYRTHLGGSRPERFDLAGCDFDHGEAVSFLVSSSQVLGMTEGWLELGDDRRALRITVDPGSAAVLPMITLRNVDDRYFCRVAFSAREMDDTSLVGNTDEDGDTRDRARRKIPNEPVAVRLAIEWREV